MSAALTSGRANARHTVVPARQVNSGEVGEPNHCRGDPRSRCEAVGRGRDLRTRSARDPRASTQPSSRRRRTHPHRAAPGQRREGARAVGRLHRRLPRPWVVGRRTRSARRSSGRRVRRGRARDVRPPGDHHATRHDVAPRRDRRARRPARRARLRRRVDPLPRHARRRRRHEDRHDHLRRARWSDQPDRDRPTAPPRRAARRRP